MEITKPEVTDKYIRIPVVDRQSGDVIRTITISSKEGIKALYAVNRRKILTYLFEKAKGWTMEKAEAWVKAHKSYKSERELIMKNENNVVQRFKLTLPIMKTRIAVIKDESGNDIEEKFVEGIASGTDVDLHGDEMALSAIQSMADSLRQHIINLNAEHDTSWQSELGEITELNVAENNDLEIEAKLNKMSKANDLWYALTELNKKLGLSIGGYVKEYVMVKDGEDEDGFPKWHRKFINIELDHIAVTSSPAYPKAWVNIISKSLTSGNSKDLIIRSEEKNMETKAKWDRAFINDLPDAAFAYVEPGGKKDDSGKTIPRTNRHFPHHSSNVKSATENDTVDKPHLRNALARCGQGAEFATQALPHLRRHAKALGIGEAAKAFFEGLEKDELIELAFQAFEFIDDDTEISKLLERSIPMKVNDSLEAEKAKKADTEVESEDEDVETSATPDNEQEKAPADESKEDEKEDSKEPEKGSEESKETESEEADETQETGTSDETSEEDESASTEEKSGKSESKESADVEESKPTEQDNELVKSVKSLTEKMTEVLKTNEALSKRIKELEEQPATRKTVEIKKGIGDEDVESVDAKTLKQEMDEKIAEVRKNNFGNPNLFAMTQKIRAEYAEKAKKGLE